MSEILYSKHVFYKKKISNFIHVCMEKKYILSDYIYFPLYFLGEFCFKTLYTT